MKNLLLVIAVIVFAVVSGFVINTHSLDTKKNNGFAVVELFTSEGCSSCPPADAALAKLKTEYGANVFVLAFHVDYWNRLGWKDKYSSSAYSKRQGEYSTLFHLSGVYTPQAVVNGTDQFTGSNVARLHSSINQQLAKTENKSWNINAKISGNKVLVSTGIAVNQTDVLHIALVENNAVSQVTAGENSGKNLQHVNVVRDFITIDATSISSKTHQLQMPAGVSNHNISVIAYTQNKKTGEVKSVVEVKPAT